MKNRWLLMLFMGVSVLAFSSGAYAKQTALEKFLNAYDQTKIITATKSAEVGKVFQWLLPQSPWPQYLHQQFEEGLQPSQYKQYLSAQNHYSCKEVAALDRIGFINLYPFLAKAFNRADILKTFELIQSNTSNGYNRCLILKRIRLHLSDAKDKRISVGPHDLGIKDIQKADPQKLRPETAYAYIYNDNIQNELAALVELAFCYSYPLALRDLLQFTKSPHLLELTPIQTYRLIREAQVMGISTAEFDDNIEVIVKMLSPELKVKVYADIKQNMARAEITMMPVLNRQCRRNGFLRHYAFLN